MHRSCHVLAQVGHGECICDAVPETHTNFCRWRGPAEEERQATATEAAPSKEGIRIDRFFLDKKFLEPPSTKFPIPGKKKGKRPNRAQRGSYRSPGMREAVRPLSAHLPSTEKVSFHTGCSAVEAVVLAPMVVGKHRHQ